VSDASEDYAAEVQRAFDDHDPAQEPYASMSRAEVFALMEAEGLSTYEYERLNRLCTLIDVAETAYGYLGGSAQFGISNLRSQISNSPQIPINRLSRVN
jgi:hypothetical protein